MKTTQRIELEKPWSFATQLELFVKSQLIGAGITIVTIGICKLGALWLF